MSVACSACPELRRYRVSLRTSLHGQDNSLLPMNCVLHEFWKAPSQSRADIQAMNIGEFIRRIVTAAATASLWRHTSGRDMPIQHRRSSDWCLSQRFYLLPVERNMAAALTLALTADRLRLEISYHDIGPMLRQPCRERTPEFTDLRKLTG